MHSLHPVCECWLAEQLNLVSSKQPQLLHPVCELWHLVRMRFLPNKPFEKKFVPRPVISKYEPKMEFHNRTWHANVRSFDENGSHANSHLNLPLPASHLDRQTESPRTLLARSILATPLKEKLHYVIQAMNGQQVLSIQGRVVIPESWTYQCC